MWHLRSISNQALNVAQINAVQPDPDVAQPELTSSNTCRVDILLKAFFLTKHNPERRTPYRRP